MRLNKIDKTDSQVPEPVSGFEAEINTPKGSLKLKMTEPVAKWFIPMLLLLGLFSFSLWAMSPSSPFSQPETSQSQEK
jgi:hypothetical protein